MKFIYKHQVQEVASNSFYGAENSHQTACRGKENASIGFHEPNKFTTAKTAGLSPKGKISAAKVCLPLRLPYGRKFSICSWYY